MPIYKRLNLSRHWILVLTLVFLFIGNLSYYLMGAPQVHPPDRVDIKKSSGDDLDHELYKGRYEAIYKEMGTPYHHKFKPLEYNAHAQVWAITQNKQGLIYAGCSEGGVLEYDGTSWRQIPLPNLNTVVRSLCVAEDGKIYVGAKKELGYLEPDENGKLHYISLMDHIPSGDRDFQDVWDTFETPDGIYFYSFTRILRWNNGRFKTWDVFTNGSPTYIEDAFYIADREGRLLRLEHDTFIQVAQRKEFLRGIMALLPLPAPNKDVLVIRWKGTLKPFDLETGEYTDSFKVPEATNLFLDKHTFYNYSRLPDGRIFINTLTGGSVLLDPMYNILKIFTKRSGLPDENVYCSHFDRQGAMWVGTAQGMSRMELDTPFSFYNEDNGLKGSPLDITRHFGTLYVATFYGVFYLENSRFIKIEGIDNSCWDLLSLDKDRLLVACINGVYMIENKKSRRLQDLVQVFCIVRSRHRPYMFYLGLKEGFKIILYRPEEKEPLKQWLLKEPWKKKAAAVKNILEDDDGEVWLDIDDSGAARIRVNPNGNISNINWYTHFKGVRKDTHVSISSYKGDVIAYGEKGFFRFYPEMDQFKPAPDLNQLFHIDSTWINLFTPDKRGNYWIIKQKEKKRWLSFARRRPGAGKSAFDINDIPFRRIPRTEINFIFPEPDGITWFDADEGLYRYTPQLKKDYRLPFKTLIREVTVGETNIPVFSGTFSTTRDGKRQIVEVQTDEMIPVLSYKNNTVKISFSAANFDQSSKNRYSFYLEGLGKTWSPWSRGVKKEYNSLWEGRYTFHVKARDIYGNESETATFGFYVTAPWYRTFWAYIGYGILFSALFYCAIRIYSYRLKKTNAVLEEQVERRTREISRQKEAIEEQARELLKANESTRRERETADSANQSKSRFLARMSHEIRTPLNSVIGFSEILRETPLNDEQYEYVNTIQRSGDALISIINDILDFSRIEAGELTLDAIDFDPEMIAFDVCEMVMPRLAGKPVELMCSIGDHVPAFVTGDAIRFRQVLLNLLGNASKFTEKGEIEVSLEAEDEIEEKTGPGMASSTRVKLHIKVRDTGIGILPEMMASVFDAFRQADGSISRKYGGTGLGLPISREIARLMDGDIWAESTPDKGSTFHFMSWMNRSGKKSGFCYKTKSLNGKRVALVDDNLRHLEIIAHSLECPGLIVEGLTQARDVLPFLRKSLDSDRPVDLCIIDLNLGDTDGIDLAREIRSSPPPLRDIPMLAFSSSLQRRSTACKEAGFNGFLPKPVRRRRLLQMIDHLIKINSGKTIPEASELVTQHSIQKDSKSSIHILLAEDNPINRKLAVHMLEHGGYRITAVSGGEQAVQAIIEEPGRFDLVFMDVRMPGMDGREATRQIRANGYCEIPIIAVTADSFKEDREKCIEAGMNDFISKPIKRETTFQIIKKWSRAFQKD